MNLRTTIQYHAFIPHAMLAGELPPSPRRCTYMHRCSLLVQAIQVKKRLWRSSSSSLLYSTSDNKERNQTWLSTYISCTPSLDTPPLIATPSPFLPTKVLPQRPQACPGALGVWDGGCGVKPTGGAPGKGWASFEAWTLSGHGRPES